MELLCRIFFIECDGLFGDDRPSEPFSDELLSIFTLLIELVFGGREGRSKSVGDALCVELCFDTGVDFGDFWVMACVGDDDGDS